MEAHLGDGRLYAANNLLAPNYSADLGIKELSFEDAVEPRSADLFVKHYIAPANSNRLAFAGNPMQITLPQRLEDLELAGVRLLALPDPGCQAICAHLRLLYLDKAAEVGVFALPTPQPMLWFPSRIGSGTRVPASPFEAASVSAPLRELFTTSSTARLTNMTTNSLSATVQTHQARLLVIRQVNFPGWHARVNGRRTSLLTVDGVFQGVQIPSGTSTLTVSYTPSGLRASELLSLLAALLCTLIAAFAIARHHPRRHSPTPSSGLPESLSRRSRV